MVARMKRKNCRNSDCQFSATSTRNSEDVTKSPHPIGACPCIWSSSLLFAQPAKDWPTMATTKIAKNPRLSALSWISRRMSAPCERQDDHHRQPDDDDRRPHPEHDPHPDLVVRAFIAHGPDARRAAEPPAEA